MRYESKGFILHVRQTPKVHAELKAFLAGLMREQVSIEVRILLVSEGTYENAPGRWAKKTSLEYTLLDDVGVYRWLERVQGDRHAHVMQFPKFTVYDGQEYKTGGVLSAPSCRIQPTISKDRQHVTLQAVIENKCEKENEKPAEGPVICDFDFKLAVTAKVPDQRTVAFLAGTTSIDVKTEESPAILSRIPYANRLVRNVGYSKQSMRVIVLLSPRILREEEVLEVRPFNGTFQPPADGKFPLMLPHTGKY
jgi:hypothetical protein